MCIGRITKQIEQRELKISKDAPEKRTMWREDLLSFSTKYLKSLIFGISDLLEKFQNSTFYKIMFYTTQPAHLIVAISILTVLGLLAPSSSSVPKDVPPIWTLIYLGSFSMHLGAQIWMTFISGLSLYFSIPRHTFGCVQQVLFPKYFLLNAILSFITLSVFVKTHNVQIKNIETVTQTISMTLCFMIELIIRLYLTSPLLKLISGKNQIEKEAGVGMEVGQFDPGSLADNMEYMKLHKSFRKVHMIIAIGNIITMGCTMLHLHYLSHKISMF